ncbi:MAG: 2-amino-4-hydroxy-6-hydroxymethyldihydropteridine diphosphokinase [Methylacidiphilales bacterium]|nr:2-amino-4-hydroxy-6-hydroxymethyldihydropteridine diphosphokinase [Candidatus Methylacidiphilales bacterium]
MKCAIGLGSNWHYPLVQIIKALTILRQDHAFKLITHSSLYQSFPSECYLPQPEYLNIVVIGDSVLEAPCLLQSLQAIERRLGRTPARTIQSYYPRVIDCDLLWMEHYQSTSVELTLPHPGIVKRDFVYYPFCELLPNQLIDGDAPLKLSTTRIISPNPIGF